jgi:HEPN domain-containing protein
LANPKMVKQWFTFAIRELKAAKAVRSLGAEYKHIVAFNSQQCVEKAIKGYLVFHDVRPPKTHSIKDLAKLVIGIDKRLGTKLLRAEKLTKYAVSYRYPDAERKPLTLKNADSALKMAQRLYDELLTHVER